MKYITNCIWAELSWMGIDVRDVDTNGYREMMINLRFVPNVRALIGIYQERISDENGKQKT